MKKPIITDGLPQSCTPQTKLKETDMYRDFKALMQLWVEYYNFYEEEELAEDVLNLITKKYKKAGESMYSYIMKRLFLAEMYFWKNIDDDDIQQHGIVYIRKREGLERKYREFNIKDEGFFEANWLFWM